VTTDPFKGYWWGATGVAGMGRNKIAIGNLVHDVSLGTPDPTNPSSVPNTFPWPFSTGIAVYTDSNALVANNLLAATTTTLSTTLKLNNRGQTVTYNNVPYPFDYRYGIDVNQILLGGIAGQYSGGNIGKCPKGAGNLNAECFPWEYRPGVVIRDNWVHQHGRVGVAWSGGGTPGVAGSGPQIYNNHVQHDANSTCYTVDGYVARRGGRGQ
jgi:hypothetical protein